MERCTIKETCAIKGNLVQISDMIYDHFIDLSQYPELKHSVREIFMLIQKDDFKGFFVYNQQNRLVGYLVGEIIITDDGRRTFYISYLYTTPAYRNKGIATSLINIVINNCINRYGINFVTLTCDSRHSKTYQFYHKLAFKEDHNIKTIEPFVVLTNYTN